MSEICLKERKRKRERKRKKLISSVMKIKVGVARPFVKMTLVFFSTSWTIKIRVTSGEILLFQAFRQFWKKNLRNNFYHLFSTQSFFEVFINFFIAEAVTLIFSPPLTLKPQLPAQPCCCEFIKAIFMSHFNGVRQTIEINSQHRNLVFCSSWEITIFYGHYLTLTHPLGFLNATCYLKNTSYNYK